MKYNFVPVVGRVVCGVVWRGAPVLRSWVHAVHWVLIHATVQARLGDLL